MKSLTLHQPWDKLFSHLCHICRGQSLNIIRSLMTNSEHYSEMLQNKLMLAVWSECWGQLSKKVVLLHDNARPHTAAYTVNIFQQLRSEILEHPPHGPCCIWSSSVQIPRRFNRLFCWWPWVKVGNSYIVCCLTENIFLMVYSYISLCNAEPNVLNSREIMLKVMLL
jgi:hypothetical protein